MNEKIDVVAGKICEMGCASVREYIFLLEQGGNHDIFTGLNEEERKILCCELISIMNVYE